MRAILPNRQTGVVPHVFSRLEYLTQARSPPKSTQGSASPLLFGQDVVKVSARHFEPATFALATRKKWVTSHLRSSPTVPDRPQRFCSTGVPTRREATRRGPSRSA